MMYSVRFYDEVRNEIFCVWEMKGGRFTRWDWFNITHRLYEEAALGFEKCSLYADVYCCNASDLKSIPVNERGIITAFCETHMDGSTVDALIYANGMFVRKMCIAC